MNLYRTIGKNNTLQPQELYSWLALKIYRVLSLNELNCQKASLGRTHL